MEKLLADVYHNFEHRDAIRDEDTAFIELEKDYAPDMGIMLCGAIDEGWISPSVLFPIL